MIELSFTSTRMALTNGLFLCLFPQGYLDAVFACACLLNDLSGFVKSTTGPVGAGERRSANILEETTPGANGVEGELLVP